ncbi:MAG TPA: DUF4251 domain-containing protein, partial [Bacteroidales bacterium]|nr:DUF4251 domain-containing protein [Bacteroidales bacterium]
DLVPRLNYIIVDGNKAVISTAYFGRQWDIRPIAGINVRGNTERYEVTNKYSKGMYQISMKVSNQSALFNVNLTVGKNGTVNAYVDGIRIETARYRGYVVPIRNQNQENNSEQQDSDSANVI